MSIKSYAITSAVSLAVGAASGGYGVREWFPRVVTITPRIESKVKIIRVRTRETTKPDGTRIVEHTDTTSDTSRKSDSTVSSISQPHPRWNVSLLGGANLQLQPVFGAQANYRLVGPFTVGAFAVGSPSAGYWAAGAQVGVTF